MKQISKQAILLFIILTFLCGIIYPLVITVVANLIFPNQATGSRLTVNGKEVGSELIGQTFTGMKYFWGRPTKEELEQNRMEYLQSTSNNQKEVPQELLTNSASGVDPNISLETAYYQVERIAKARKVSPQKIEQLIEDFVEGKFGLGEPVVNVLKLNIQLDKMW